MQHSDPLTLTSYTFTYDNKCKLKCTSKKSRHEIHSFHCIFDTTTGNTTEVTKATHICLIHRLGKMCTKFEHCRFS
jgi:hypothetical protein